jgi:hypothetical protein
VSATQPNSWAALLAGYPSKKYLHLSMMYPEALKLAAHNQVQHVVNQSEDWLRYADNCWLVWTSDTPEQLYAKLAAIPTLKDVYIFILEVNISRAYRSGQFPNWVWEWLDKDRGSMPALGLGPTFGI